MRNFLIFNNFIGSRHETEEACEARKYLEFYQLIQLEDEVQWVKLDNY